MKDKKYVKTGDCVTIEGVTITFKKGETIKQFADRINKTIGRKIAKYDNKIKTIFIKEILTNG